MEEPVYVIDSNIAEIWAHRISAILLWPSNYGKRLFLCAHTKRTIIDEVICMLSIMVAS